MKVDNANVRPISLENSVFLKYTFENVFEEIVGIAQANCKKEGFDQCTLRYTCWCFVNIFVT